ncbi:hypothetical protein SAY86_008467 [Trapa natans]|uniref:Glycosyltransferase n=1 Tax=Trapa natans TaxID=22666 RepID=A0AAN7K9G3_TRANT|nr:hypothetical protein SAY86_008467 [Trapa natans]
MAPSTSCFLMVSFPSQGHINPSLALAKRFLRTDFQVTFATSKSALRRMHKLQQETPDGLSYESFSDGYDDGIDFGVYDIQQFMDSLKTRGPETLRDLIDDYLRDGRKKIVHVFYTTLIPWVADVARSFGLRSTLVWTQPATVLDIYYYYFNGHGDAIRTGSTDPSSPILLPGLPPLNGKDVPSFFAPENHYTYFLPLMKRQFEILDEQQGQSHKVLVNTFEALEEGPLHVIPKLNLVGIGPLLPYAFLDRHNPSDTSFGGDLFRGNSKNYIEWLDTKPGASVIYLSFGSIHVLKKKQKDELTKALILCGLPFLWVMRETAKNDMEGEEEEEQLIYGDELERQGMVVPWCAQVEVLSHPSIGCIVTHCGWNSTSESLACGVPMVAFPQWVDQKTNAKLIEDVWRTGVRLKTTEAGDGIVVAEEIRRCVELVMKGGNKGEEIRKNASKWKELAMEATREGGSSERNLRAFLDEISRSA